MADASASEYVVIGPSKVGKTALLSTLQHAAFAWARGQCGFESVEVRPSSETMVELFHEVTATLKHGQLPINASTELTEYGFEVSTRGHRPFLLFLRREHVTRVGFKMLDSPGGAIFGSGTEGGDVDYEAMARFREHLVNSLRTARGLLLCVSAINPDQAFEFFCDLPQAFNRTGLAELPAQRVAICVTKADAFTSQRSWGRSSLENLRAECPLEVARSILSKPTFATLRQFLRPDAQVAFGFASAYGFLEHEGCANFDPERQGLMVHVGDEDGNTDGSFDPARKIDAWQPYQVLHPFLFLATGMSDGLTVVKAKDL